MSRSKRILLISAGMLQGMLLVGGAFNVAWTTFGPLAGVFRALGVLNGTGFGYSFFAPEVNANVLVRFEVREAGGKTLADKLDSGANREASIRISNLAEAFDGEDIELRQSLAASWAAANFSRHPNAESVTTIVESCDVPPMESYRKGEREYCSRMYEAKFAWPKGSSK